jgi:hypothetical protein
LIHRVYQRAIKPALYILQNFKEQVPLFNRPKAEKNIPDKAVSNCKSKKGFLDCVSFWHKKGFSQWSKVSPKTALQGLSPDGLHGREP